jgi:hypothetical protein
VQGQTFSNGFSNADDYVRSRLNAGELKAQYSNQIRPPVNAGELKTTAWHARALPLATPLATPAITYGHA